MQTIPLLPCLLEASISGHDDFTLGCSMGFDCYEEYAECPEGFGALLTLNDVQGFVVSEVGRRYDVGEVVYGASSLPFRAGFCLGFLSAFASASRDLAFFGVACLSYQVPFQYREEVQRGFDPLSRTPGDGSDRGCWE